MIEASPEHTADDGSCISTNKGNIQHKDLLSRIPGEIILAAGEQAPPGTSLGAGELQALPVFALYATANPSQQTARDSQHLT